MQDPQTGAWRYFLFVQRTMQDELDRHQLHASKPSDKSIPKFFFTTLERPSSTNGGHVYGIRRSYGDFKRLYAAIVAVTGESALPRFPTDTLFAYFTGETQSNLLKKRVALESLLQAIESHPVASDTAAYQEFLANTETYEQYSEAPVSPVFKANSSRSFSETEYQLPAHRRVSQFVLSSHPEEMARHPRRHSIQGEP
ncbi:hypothetical protein Poli38472_010584 [Pythium oligandrum]|uniref:PX domain-containing protein n=1 Tax=Pythium oligandrum TaxID=41045 RepID=A0A8K1C3C5_PYTOL|nr:hypothetical protein Poli38472_010584 [Pythium oligandrum]|eukprot:TMW55702.1 hypothetical protein Poli38472_010584 [Pythium oligandrum]